ncbi:ATP-dependent DNA helicase RecG [Thermosulfuriphilus ammonigenes]|uniref:ATP-dependent DNA helicase RecG n=1 Tax=Thermosulfuriphilus ammonigenes TaxID=1936021 RepID=A0A6G7PWR7_9BACT|nr:ATP-dependent DNA helicase RecG [Thermosulfuriphilus ammonigenes]MBA2847803.1 ATP-dependent DNA helicase RecG [Thermosulfuriphilus ammonigenes]QIJ71996.1 ATP-dependent DNA helicase RecG [Thermosulfuriphilus ammonigenes]
MAFRSFLERLKKPLLLATRDHFSRLPRIKGLEEAICHLIDTAPPEVKGLSWAAPILKELKGLFEAFEKASPAEKKARLEQALALVADLEAGPAFLEEESPLPDEAKWRHMRLELARPLQYLKGVGPRLAAKFASRGINTIEDLLFFFPRAYEDRRQFAPIGSLRPGDRATVRGEILLSGAIQYRRRRVYEVVISDGTGTLSAKWFHFREADLRHSFTPGRQVIFSGEIRLFASRKEIIHPEVEFPEASDIELHVRRIVPVYPQIEGVSAKVIRRIIREALEKYGPMVHNFIPDDVRRRRRLLSLSRAIKGLHFPREDDDLQALNTGRSPYHRALAFDELFFLELGLALRKRSYGLEEGIAFQPESQLVRHFLKGLPFRLTRAQERAFEEIRQDMTRPVPMNRLLQGDVGCGKTVVAFLAALLAVDNGYQVAIMAPTEILAEQHYLNFRQMAGLAGVNIELLTSSRPPKEKRAIYEGLAKGYIQVAVGTHALIQKEVHFARLGLVIIDEQHRFGVLQRAALREKARICPDTLVMTATPIPRTLSLTLYGDLDVSIIDELPAGRKPVITKVFRGRERRAAYELVRQELAKGHQAYVVYPLVEESEKMDLLAATESAHYLQKEIFPDYPVGLLHGKMRPAEKEAVMSAFKAGEIKILVATTVIEVGIDVPQATVMVIEHAERFGLSQLHQLRGRVGRSHRASYCLLIAYRVARGSEAARRLAVMCQTNDGFRIAEEDLKIRGPGEFLGTKQSGFPEFKRADLIRDYKILLEARQEAFSLIERDPDLSRPEHKMLKRILYERWAERLALAEVA